MYIIELTRSEAKRNVDRVGKTFLERDAYVLLYTQITVTFCAHPLRFKYVIIICISLCRRSSLLGTMAGATWLKRRIKKVFYTY